MELQEAMNGLRAALPFEGSLLRRLSVPSNNALKLTRSAIVTGGAALAADPGVLRTNREMKRDDLLGLEFDWLAVDGPKTE
jgi:hypothetical protein